MTYTRRSSPGCQTRRTSSGALTHAGTGVASSLRRQPSSPALPPLPRLALGFFHTERPLATARTRNRKAPTRPRFVPLSSGARLLGFSGPLSSALSEAVEGAGHGFLDHSRPVASRMGRLLLELRREGHADRLSLCVCNPMTGDMALLPPVPNPGFYACTVLCGDDLDPPRPSRTFFRVLIVYNRHRHTAMRSYSSDSRCWSREVKTRSKDQRRQAAQVWTGPCAPWCGLLAADEHGAGGAARHAGARRSAHAGRRPLGSSPELPFAGRDSRREAHLHQSGSE
ncbi:hypothetical protein ZWY2020_029759 [Hordeum vulgare]|nr:hypothetical protein ZWY2020_029759 [Hordeum vulgare]